MTEMFQCERNRKLTEADIEFIRNSKSSLRKLGSFFGVSHKTIYYWKSELNRKVESLRSSGTKRDTRERRKLLL